jgi:hypothetical protein
MPDPHDAGPAGTRNGPPPRPVTFAGRLRANLPSPPDLVIYAAITAALWLLCHFTVPAALTVTAVAATARIIVLAAVDHATARRLPIATRRTGHDQGGENGDG